MVVWWYQLRFDICSMHASDVLLPLCVCCNPYTPLPSLKRQCTDARGVADTRVSDTLGRRRLVILDERYVGEKI